MSVLELRLVGKRTIHCSAVDLVHIGNFRLAHRYPIRTSWQNGKPGAAHLGLLYMCSYGVSRFGYVVIDSAVLWAGLVGLTAGVVIGFTTEYFTSDEYKPVRNRKVSKSGAAITIINGFSYGLVSIVPSIIGIVIAMLIALCRWISVISGVCGIGIAAVVLAVSGMIVFATVRS